MNKESEKTKLLFEVSWEVTNKCGGIYTVITSKIPLMKANYDSYCLIGPLFDKLPQDFTPQVPPETYARAFSHLALEGIRCVYGTWNVQGSPKVILIDARSLLKYANNIKSYLWEKFEIDSLNSSFDFDEPLVWSWAVGKFLENISSEFTEENIIGHFHEWLSGFGLLYIKDKNINVATTFTTHATMLGRTLASHNIPFEKEINFNPYDKARELGVADKFSTERACALNADQFTTVSKITAHECKLFFGVDPLVLPNGISEELFPSFEQNIFQHSKSKEKLYEFTMSHFFPYQNFDLTNTLFFYYGGRYEYKNKGFDIIIESLSKLNDYLISTNSKKTIVMFFFVAMNAGSPRKELLENKNIVENLIEKVHEKADLFLERITLSVLQGSKLEDTLPENFLNTIRNDFKIIRKDGNPLICTHNIDEKNDPTIKYLRQLGLDNKPENKVKVVFMPTYLNGSDGLLNMDYYETVSGCHLGLFPSFYEPWGYTPLESIALAVPAITSNTAGFGKHILENSEKNHKGLFILDRHQDYPLIVEELFSNLKEISDLNRDERIKLKINAHSLSSFADWRQLIKFYLQAHENALKNKDERI